LFNDFEKKLNRISAPSYQSAKNVLLFALAYSRDKLAGFGSHLFFLSGGPCPKRVFWAVSRKNWFVLPSPLLSMKRLLPFWIVVMLVFLPGSAFGGEPSEPDTNWIVRYNHHISLAGHITRIDLNSGLTMAGRPERVQYRTANAHRLGFSFDYRWIGFELFGRLPVQGSERRGITFNRGIYTRVNRSRFWANAIYQEFSGFYWSNPVPFIRESLPPGFYPQRPDLDSRLLFLNSFYVFRPRHFSNPAAQGENERQKKSGGSPIAGLGVYHNSLTGTSPLLPFMFNSSLQEFRDIRSIRSWIFSLNMGYAHTFVWHKHVFLALYAIPGLARSHAFTTRLDGMESQIPSRWTLRMETRASLGYNSDRYFGGFMYSSFFNNQELEADADYAYGFHTFRIFFGRRFALKRELGFLHL
jgi:hypothetical protein